MAPSPLMADQTLFSDPDIFETTHLLEVFNYRDPQVENLAFALRPAFLAEREVTAAGSGWSWCGRGGGGDGRGLPCGDCPAGRGPVWAGGMMAVFPAP